MKTCKFPSLSFIAAILALSVNVAHAQAEDSTGPQRLTGVSQRAMNFVGANSPSTPGPAGATGATGAPGATAPGSACGAATFTTGADETNTYGTWAGQQVSCQGYRVAYQRPTANTIQIQWPIVTECPPDYTSGQMANQPTGGSSGGSFTMTCFKN